MILYHYTSKLHLPFILETGFLKPVESNYREDQPHAAPDVVWLTTDRTPCFNDHGLYPAKTEVQILIDLARPIRWRNWRWHPRDREWLTKLETAAGAGDAARGRRLASTWYVWPAPIFRRRWRALIVDDLECDMTTGAPYPACNECCDTLVHGDAVEDPETGDSFHAECLAYRRSENSRE